VIHAPRRGDNIGFLELDLQPSADQSARERRNTTMLEAPLTRAATAPLRSLGEQVLATVGLPLLVLDADLRVRLANRAVCRAFQVSSEDTLDRPFSELGQGEWSIPRLRELLEQIFTGDTPVQDFEVEQVFPLIGSRIMLLNAHRLVGTHDAHDALLLLTIEDVTERKAQAQRGRDFVRLISHELRTPLTAILGYAQLLHRRGVYDDKAVATIIAQGRQLNRLVDDLLDVSRLEAGELQLRRSRMDLVAVARAALEQAQLSSPLHRLRLTSPDEALEGWWDRGRLGQVFANLLGNALKYSPAGGEILLTIDDLGSTVRVSIEDEGLGIAPAALPHLFDRFYRAPATATQFQGLGLGLHVTKALVEAHGGWIQVESLLGCGSVFSFVLPRSDQ
jgi:signal transduction histidine kinase